MGDEVVKIPLHDATGAVVAFAVVDAAEGHLAAVRWYLNKSKEGSVYVRRDVQVKGRRKRLYLHRVVTDCPPGFQVDHRDGDPLNNRRGNLEVVTLGENTRRRDARRTAVAIAEDGLP